MTTNLDLLLYQRLRRIESDRYGERMNNVTCHVPLFRSEEEEGSKSKRALHSAHRCSYSPVIAKTPPDLSFHPPNFLTRVHVLFPLAQSQPRLSHSLGPFPHTGCGLAALGDPEAKCCHHHLSCQATAAIRLRGSSLHWKRASSGAWFARSSFNNGWFRDQLI